MAPNQNAARAGGYAAFMNNFANGIRSRLNNSIRAPLGKIQLGESMREFVCSICLEGPEPGDKWYMPKCEPKKHMMHLACFEMNEKYLKSQNPPRPHYCPKCRAELKPGEGSIQEID